MAGAGTAEWLLAQHQASENTAGQLPAGGIMFGKEVTASTAESVELGCPLLLGEDKALGAVLHHHAQPGHAGPPSINQAHTTSSDFKGRVGKGSLFPRVLPRFMYCHPSGRRGMFARTWCQMSSGSSNYNACAVENGCWLVVPPRFIASTAHQRQK